MRKLFLALSASLALAVAACGPGAEQPVNPQPPAQPGAPGDPGTSPGAIPSPDDLGGESPAP